MNTAQLSHPMVDVARKAVIDACAVCREVQRNGDKVRSVTKDDRSPVTVADFASQAIIAHRLQELDAGLKLVGEENADALRAAPALLDHVVDAVRCVWSDATPESVVEAIDLGGADGGAANFWTLDPIDGTKGFLRGQQYAVSLAYLEQGQPTLGVLGCPNLSADFNREFSDPDPTGVIYVAVKGAGVEQHAATDGGNATSLESRTGPADGAPVRVCESVEKAHSSHDATQQILDRIGRSRDPQRLDSQCKYAVVARGQADAYLRMPTKKGYVERIWDHAAGALVATESGCQVTDVRGAPLDFTQGRGLERNLGVVCAPAPLHGELIEAIGALKLDQPPESR